MEEMFTHMNDRDVEDSQFTLSRDIRLAENSSDIPGCRKPEKFLASDVKKKLAAVRCIQESFLQTKHWSDLRIPKYIHFVNLDERYFCSCLDLVEFEAANSSSIVCTTSVPNNIAMDLRSSKTAVLVDDWRLCRRGTSGLASFVIQCPAGLSEWILSTTDGIDNSKILKGPLLGHLSSLGSIQSLGIAGSVDDAKQTKPTSFMKSLTGVSISSPQKLEIISPRSKKYGPHPFHVSTANSVSSFKSSSAAPATFYQGMLHCVWKCGIPQFVYSVDDQREMYIANLLKTESSDFKDPDYVYLFRLKMDGGKEHGTSDNAYNVIGKMNVLSSFTLCSDNSKIMETEFVVFGSEDYFGNMQSADLTHRKNKGSSRKILDTFSTKHLWRHRSSSKFGAKCSTPEDLSGDPFKASLNKLTILGGVNFLDNPPNNELAVVLVKEHLKDDHRDAEVGGWGLKFLENFQGERASSSQEASISSGSFHDQSDCSISMNVLIPSGFHGGPQTRNGGPSSLTERWRSGGHCDCGGWDIGCPLTILNNRSSKEVWTQTDSQEDCESLDLVIKGSKQGEPPLKIVNIHDGLYCIHFQSTMSVLQSLSISVAIIHSQSPTLSPKPVQKMNSKNKG